MSLEGLAIDWIEKFARTRQDPEAHHLGSASPHYHVSPAVTISQEDGAYVYHVPDDQLGHGGSFGNAAVWAETKGNGDVLRMFSVEAGRALLGGLSVSFVMPFQDLSALGQVREADDGKDRSGFTVTMPYGGGAIHLHPACQQREFVIGDGLRVLRTFFVPRTGMDDPAIGCTVVNLRNDTPHPVGVTLIGCLDLRGHTRRDLRAAYDPASGGLMAWNESQQEHVRVFGASEKPAHYWATCDLAQATAPSRSLPDLTDEHGDLLGALQFNVTLLPGANHRIRLFAGFCTNGREKAHDLLQDIRQQKDLLSRTIRTFGREIARSDVKVPSDVLTQGIQWCKANMLRVFSRYPQGDAFTNDPGRSTHIVGRDAAWYVHGSDFTSPEISCSLLALLARHQRDDGLIAEFIDGITGQTEFWDFNINDNTPLFITAVDHHWSTTRHRDCLEQHYEPVRKAAELILKQRNQDGLVCCTATGTGAQGICGWRNVLENEQINGAVTELNAECYDALRSAAHLCRAMGDEGAAQRYEDEATRLRDLINEKLVDPRTHLFVRNIDLHGRVMSEPTVDMVFPLLFHVADRPAREAVVARMFAPDFMSTGGLRAVPFTSPRWDPSGQAGCMGGVWPGANWWFAMGCVGLHNRIMAQALERSYQYYVQDPKTYNTVPGQFNEWSDGQTLVNRGMRLSPWAPPRFLWAAVEGLAGLSVKEDDLTVNPKLPSQWSWLQVSDLLFRDRSVSFFVTRQHGELHLYTCQDLQSDLTIHRYDETLSGSVEPLTTGMTATVLRKKDEYLLFFASSRDQLLVGPLLAHRALRGHDSFEVHRLSSMEQEWHVLGRLDRQSLQRIAVRIEPQGYTLFRFRP